MSIDLHKINLRKEHIFNLKKAQNIEEQKSQFVLVLDYSGSMENLYRTGVVQDTVERLLPLGLAFDDNGEIETYLFHDGIIKLNQNISLYNIDGYINKNVIGKYNMGGTNYAPAINKVVEDFGNEITTSGRLFGFGGTKAVSISQYPTYVIFITDGENSDRENARDAIVKASQHGIFFQFVGIGNENFRFLQELDTMTGRMIDNANFFKVPNIHTASDEDLYGLLLAEFPSWLKLARNHSLIR